MPDLTPYLQQRLPFPFPAPEVQFGIPLTNSALGALIWGEGGRVRITLNRADYPTTVSGASGVLPLGRVELELPEDWSLAAGGLHLVTGEAEVDLTHPRSTAKLRASILRTGPVLCLRITGLEGGSIRVHSRPPDSPEAQERFRALARPPAQVFDLGTFGGWVQEHPGQPALCPGWLRHENAGGLLLYVTAAYGADPQSARRAALEELEAANSAGYTPSTLRTFSEWRKWWQQARGVSLPAADLDLLYHRALERLAGNGAADPDYPELLLPVAELSCEWMRRPSNPQWAKMEAVFDPAKPVTVVSLERNTYWTSGG